MITVHVHHIWSPYIYIYMMIWSSYMIIIDDHHTWSSYMIIIHDHHIAWSYMMIMIYMITQDDNRIRGMTDWGVSSVMYDHHIWSPYMIIIYAYPIYMIIIYDQHIWSSYMITIHDHHIVAQKPPESSPNKFLFNQL